MPEQLSDPHVQQFLARKAVVVLATIQADGAPLATPMWFLHEADALTMISVADTQKVRNLRRDPRVSVAAEAGAGGDIASVTIQGRAEFLDDSAERRHLVDRLLAKYEPYLERRWRGRAVPPDRVVFRITPTRVTSWGLTPPGR